jgi:hypothetical protein
MLTCAQPPRQLQGLSSEFALRYAKYTTCESNRGHGCSICREGSGGIHLEAFRLGRLEQGDGYYIAEKNSEQTRSATSKYVRPTLHLTSRPGNLVISKPLRLRSIRPPQGKDYEKAKRRKHHYLRHQEKGWYPLQRILFRQRGADG